MSRPVAIVTGASRGIGLAIAQSLSVAGFDIAATSIGWADDKAAIEARLRKAGADVLFHEGDIGDLDSHAPFVAAVLDRFGHIDCLINNAGIASPVRGDLLDLEPAHFDLVMSVNLRGTMFLSQAVARAMLSDADDRPRTIVNITSVSAEMASPERADYCISKAGLSMWTRLLALRLAGEGVSVFEVRPGIIRTDMTAAVSAKYDALIDDGLVPMRRWGEANDIGRAVAMLAGGGMGFATGSVLNLDGGLSVPRL
jgi:NAD(P)-dependent dehydrogenase (short-subunit alcohol dehydrogenase family)